jgi:hypothetical protein
MFTSIKNSMSKKRLVPILLLLVLFAQPFVSYGHAIDLGKLPSNQVGWIYLKLGFTHILPLGLDHILFVLCIFFLGKNLKSILIQATAFTISHSITLILAVTGVFSPPSNFVEPIIALSIFYVAIENSFVEKVKPTRIVLITLFGLIHGMGFASVLNDLGLPPNKFTLSLIMFNIGVEIGQITVILLAWFLIGKWFWKKRWYRKRIVVPISFIIAGVALFWTIERIFFN